jgi:hypothetical protein
VESNCLDYMTSNHLLPPTQEDKKKQMVPPHLLPPTQEDKKPAASKAKRQKLAGREVEESTPDDKGRSVTSATGTVAGSPAAKKKAHRDISEDDSAEKEVSRYLATWRRLLDNVHFDESTPFSDGRQKKAWISRNPIVWIT